MKPGTLTFPMPSSPADSGGSPLPAALPSLIRLLMGLGGWPDDHGIRVCSPGRRAPLVHARVATSRRVVEILFDPSTGRYECINCQAPDFDLPPAIPKDAQGGFVVAVIRGLTAAAATALLEGATALLSPWPQWAAVADADDDTDPGDATPDEEGVCRRARRGAVRRKPAA